jgi:hypothetical protein
VGWGDVDWIGLAKDRNRWRALVNSVLNLRVPWNAGKLSSALSSSVQLHIVIVIENRTMNCKLQLLRKFHTKSNLLSWLTVKTQNVEVHGDIISWNVIFFMVLNIQIMHFGNWICFHPQMEEETATLYIPCQYNYDYINTWEQALSVDTVWRRVRIPPP